MPKQNSILPISGRLGDWVFYYRKAKRGRKNYFVRRAPEVVHQTAATKKTASDFGTASKASRLIRQALKSYTCHYKDETLHYRLNARLAQILRQDTTSPAGQKSLLPEHMSALTGFRFNSETHVSKMDHIVNGTINIPGGKTDVLATIIALSVNFKAGKTELKSSEAILIKKGTTQTITIPEQHNQDLTLILIEIQTCREENGSITTFHDASLDIVSICQPATTNEETQVRPTLQVQPKSMAKTTLLHVYAYPFTGKKPAFSRRSTRKRYPSPGPSAPLSPSNDLSPSNPDR